MAISRFSLVALDCPDPAALAEFYIAIAGGSVLRVDDDWVRVAMPEGVDLAFQLAPDHRPPEWPDGVPQQAHLDFDVDDLDAAVEAALAVGGRLADTQPSPDHWRVMFDPAGHPFCFVLV